MNKTLHTCLILMCLAAVPYTAKATTILYDVTNVAGNTWEYS